MLARDCIKSLIKKLSWPSSSRLQKKQASNISIILLTCPDLDFPIKDLREEGNVNNYIEKFI